MSAIRKIKRAQEKAAEGELTEEQKRYPSGKIITSPVKGDFSTFPLLGWISVRAKEEVPLVMLALALIRDDSLRGTLQVELPVYEGETDKAVLASLKRYGWNGQIWSPGSEVWPTGNEESVEQLKTLMAPSKLKATLTFPPNEEGNFCAQPVEVTRARGPFLMPPLPEPEEELSLEELEAFLAICKDTTPFY